ncbi:hypothetical protein RND61_09270 [Streptomyces sp. TRM76323]|uniref:Uncharacterized protein n=1 Tax=Streptomyces tamarix TaxID=3078565 RepID=A0ABU3QHM5_9ACTN|nr:hypothetical protein [Streptomyces tamarix]MDT9682263.1 hypothetical protein [Streptomyces tamarix]
MGAAPGVVLQPPSRFSDDEDTAQRTLAGPRRALATEGQATKANRPHTPAASVVDNRAYGDPDGVFDEHPRPTPAQALAIAAWLRATATALVETVPHLVSPCPTDTVVHLIDASAEQPPPADAIGHVRRLAVAALSILGLQDEADDAIYEACRASGVRLLVMPMGLTVAERVQWTAERVDELGLMAV